MGVRDGAHGTLRKQFPLNPDSNESGDGGWLSKPVRWLISGAAILGAIAWIALADDKGTGMLLGVLAILLSRILLRSPS